MKTTSANPQRPCVSTPVTGTLAGLRPSTAGSDVETDRLRKALSACDAPKATAAAQLLLELHEPTDFAGAAAVAFPAGRASDAARTALERAWATYQHDRSRSWN